MNSNGILTTRAEVEQKEGYAYFYPDHEEIADENLILGLGDQQHHYVATLVILKIIPDYCCMRGVDELE